MSGFSPAKDVLVHNNLAHKLMFECKGLLGLSSFGDLVSNQGCLEETVLARIEQTGFEITPAGAAFITSNVPDQVLSHRERKIMRDMLRPAPSPRPTQAKPEPALINPDLSLSLAGLF